MVEPAYKNYLERVAKKAVRMKSAFVQPGSRRGGRSHEREGGKTGLDNTVQHYINFSLVRYLSHTNLQRQKV